MRKSTERNPCLFTLYVVEVGGLTGLIAAPSLYVARKEMRCEFGQQVTKIRAAKQYDVDWVRIMGGRVPKGRVARDE